MKLRHRGDGALRQPPIPGRPTVEVLFGDNTDAHVGLARVTVPPGGGMPEHDHGGSDIVLAPQVGRVEVTTADGEVTTVAAGDVALIGRDERVALTNPGSDDAELLVAAGPPDFLGTILRWPEVVDVVR
ncbi:MAG: cupin domain-containing protein [Actinomycetota bacterium]